MLFMNWDDLLSLGEQQRIAIVCVCACVRARARASVCVRACVRACVCACVRACVFAHDCAHSFSRASLQVRLMLHNPSVAKLDECTSAVDERQQELFYKLLRAWGMCFVSVGHRPELQLLHDKVGASLPPSIILHVLVFPLPHPPP
jgi:hypothetical protein